MDSNASTPRRRRGLFAGIAAAAALAVAIPASGALAEGGDNSSGSNSSSDSAGSAGFVQERDRGNDGDRRDCPKDRDGGGQDDGGQDGSGQDSSFGTFDESTEL